MYEYLQKLIAWQKEGRRSVDFKIEPEGELRIWVYDYNHQSGKYVLVGEELPTEADMIEKKRADLQRQLEELS